MRRIKYGRLYWLQIEAADIDKFLLVRIFRKLGILYIPWTLRFYNELYLREDRSKHSRRLINQCRKLGIVTYVVQEGPVYHPHQAKWSHLPLYADIFLCPDTVSDSDSKKKYEDIWIAEGMPKDRIKTYLMQKKKEQYRGVLFLEPFVTWDESHDLKSNLRNASILNTVYDWLGKDVLFRPDPRHTDLIIPYLPPNRVVRGEIADIIRNYGSIYCFAGSSVIQECKKAGKPCTLVDSSKPLPPMIRRSDENKSPSVKNYDMVALLAGPVVWDDLGFTWNKTRHNVRNFISLAELADKNVLFKPHYAHADLIMPFLPIEHVTWEKPENLVQRYKPVCFWDSSTRKDCEMLGKPHKLIGAEEIGPESG